VSRRTRMIQSFRPSVRWLLVSICLFAVFVAGCKKKPPAAAAPAYTPPPAAVKPTASLSADRTTINAGDSVKLSWTTTDATSVSIAPEVGAVTPQGSTTVSPTQSTTYTLTASSGGGNTDSSVRISVNAAAPPPAKTEGFDEMFTKEVHDAFFDYDSAEIRPDARTALQRTADFLKNYPNAHVTVEGYCDERGSTEYNLALGQRRANAVKEYLVSLGVSANNLSTTSWGKEKQFCNESTEACWQQNRRGHFTLNKP
jgi:peptidoglycan-associated lipoprotein